MNHKKIIWHISLITIFVIYLLSADMIFSDIIHVPGESNQKTFAPFPDTGHVLYNIDEISDKTLDWKEMVYIRGWAFSPDIFDNNFSVFITVQQENNIPVVFETLQIKRPDVTINLKTIGFNVDNSGFETTIPRDYLMKRSHRLGFIIKNQTSVVYSPTNLVINGSNLSYQVIT